MAKVFLTCLASLKPFYSDELAVGLFSSFSIDLEHLHKSLEEKPPSLEWCSEAVSLIKKIHSCFLHYLEMSKVPSSWEGVEMLDEYMRASLDLLDLCNLLKLAVSGLERHRMTVDAAVNRLEDSGFSIEASKIELEKLERGRRTSKLDQTNFNKKEVLSKVKTTSATNNNMRVLQTFRSTMSVISFLIVSLILHPTPTPIEMNEGLYDTKLPGLDPFLDSIQKLVNSFGQRIQIEKHEGEVVLHESKMIEDEYASFKVNVVCGVERELIIENVGRMRKRCVALKEGLHLFECVTNDLFEDVIKGRKRVIQFITQNNNINF